MIPVIELKTELQKIDKDVEILSHRKIISRNRSAYTTNKSLYYVVYKPSAQYLLSNTKLDLSSPVVLTGSDYNLLAISLQMLIEMVLNNDEEVESYLGDDLLFTTQGNAAYCIARARELGRCTKTFTNYLIQTTYNIRELTIQDMLIALISK